MGEITKKICDGCGYKKRFFTGVGIHAVDPSFIHTVFSKDRLVSFDKEWDAGNIKKFMLENQLAYCEKCKDFMTVSVLKYTVLGQKGEIIVSNYCPECGGVLSIPVDENICPKCGSKLNNQPDGLWD